MSSSSRPAPPSVHLTPAQRAALLHQTSPTFPPTTPPTVPISPHLPPSGSLVGISPAGNMLPKRDISKPVLAPAMSAVDELTAPTYQRQPSHPQTQQQRPLPSHQQQRTNGTSHQSAHPSQNITATPPTRPSAPSAQPKPATTEIATAAASTTSSLPPSAAASSNTVTKATPPTSTPSSTPHSPTSSQTATLLSHPHATSAQQPEPITTSSVRVAAHQSTLLEHLPELVRAAGVGHWQGLTTQQRKDIATQLCREHLFNPQSGQSSDSRTTVVWTAVSSWTDYDVWVTCVRTVSPYYQGDVFVTTYTAKFDQVGRLVEFDEKETKGKKNCVIQ